VNDICSDKEFVIMNVVPIRDQVIVSKEKEDEKRSSGGLYMPTIEKKNATGTVLRAGSGRVTMSGHVVPLDVKEGDKVLFNPNMATEAQDGDTTVYVLREDNILAVWR
jgi:chaperonin GroES